jgi:hypothetical protein
LVEETGGSGVNHWPVASSSRPFIWYTTCLSCKNFGFLHLMTPYYPLDELENVNNETYSSRLFIWHAYLIIALIFFTWWPNRGWWGMSSRVKIQSSYKVSMSYITWKVLMSRYVYNFIFLRPSELSWIG